MKNKKHDNEQVSQNSPEQPVPELGIDPVEVREIPIREIRIGVFCRRRSYDDLDGIVKSIEKNGLLQPVTVTADADGGFTLVCGSRRYKAHEQLGRTTIACRVVNVTPEKAAVLSLTENVDREDMHPVELARKLSSIMETFGSSEKQIADDIGWSQSTVSTLVGILALGEDVLEKIGTQTESPFKRTHAEVLAQLMRSTRNTRRVEVQALLDKTIKYKLGTKELKELVRLFLTNGYAHLPERLRTSLLRNQGMTSQMAMLYLEPAKVVEGQGKDAERQRQLAERLDKEWIENYIARAVKAAWPFEKAKQGLFEAIGERSKPTQIQEPKSSWQKLIGDISTLQDRLAICVSDISDRAKSNPGQLDWLCHEVRRLQGKCDDFLGVAVNALGENQHKQIA